MQVIGKRKVLVVIIASCRKVKSASGVVIIASCRDVKSVSVGDHCK